MKLSEHLSAFPSGETALLLAPEAASTLASQLRVFAAGSDATTASLIALADAFPLASRERPS